MAIEGQMCCKLVQKMCLSLPLAETATEDRVTV